MDDPLTAKRAVFMHVHVRKCGGSTFYQDVLGANLEDGFYRDASLIDDRYSRDQVSEILDNCPWLTGYSSHKISLDLPYDRPDVELCAVAFVRDPIERFVSHYSYLHHHAKDWDTHAKAMDVNEYTRVAIDQGWLEKQRQHSQLEQLTNRRGEEAMQWVRTIARQNGVLLCTMDRFDDLCLLLEHCYGESISDAAYPVRTNVSPRVECSDACMESLRAAFGEHEFELVKFVEATFVSALETSFPDPVLLDQLRSRFDKRRKAKSGRSFRLRSRSRR